MEEIRQSQTEGKKSLTKEYWMKWLKEHRRKKQKLVEEIQQEMRASIKESTGKDVTSFEVW